ncbi:sensor histidine kinase [Microbacterium sp. CJ88]|uniref:sensor histidine kinase n=1 Tax=Microbacterium sp. CJ88 TaxID=3445672 RepID=UPI003F659252
MVGAVVYAIASNSIAESNQRELVAATQIDSGRDAGPDVYVTIVDGRTGGQIVTPPNLPAGVLDTAAIQAVATGGGDQRSQKVVDGRSFLMLTTSATGDPRNDRIVQVALDQREGSEEIGRLVTALLVGSGIAVVLACFVSFLMARRAMRPMADALTLQRRFVADASHELRTPLTLLSTRAQMLKRRGHADLPADVTASIDDVVTDSRALTEILEDLLIAADPRGDPPHSAVDVAAVARRAVHLLAEDAEGRGVALVCIAGTGPTTVIGSEAALLRLVIALAANALDHARASVLVEVASKPSSVSIRVTDDGDGFSPAARATAFDRFASTRGEQTGSAQRHYGLGLAIVSEIARRHRGDVRIDHTSLGGSVLCSLPSPDARH